MSARDPAGRPSVEGGPGDAVGNARTRNHGLKCPMAGSLNRDAIACRRPRARPARSMANASRSRPSSLVTSRIGTSPKRRRSRRPGTHWDGQPSGRCSRAAKHGRDECQIGWPGGRPERSTCQAATPRPRISGRLQDLGPRCREDFEHRTTHGRSLGMVEVDPIDVPDEPVAEAGASGVGRDDVANESGGLGFR